MKAKFIGENGANGLKNGVIYNINISRDAKTGKLMGFSK